MPDHQSPEMNSRRDFIKKSSLGTLAGVLSMGEPLPVDVFPENRIREAGQAPMNCAVIGFGLWGREIAATLLRNEDAKLATVCDNYQTMLRRAERSLPGVATTLEYAEVLNDPAIDAVFIATPTHLHKQIVLDALSANKHVYCEAPIAASIEDARVIAHAARDSDGLIFQSGILYRTEPQFRSVFGFIRSGAIGMAVMARAQYHVRESWRRASASSERAAALNWRLESDLSIGLAGEIGIQQYDTARWILGDRPTAVSGFGNVMYWRDGREIPDVVQTVMEFPGGVNMMLDISLVSSFDKMYDVFYGSDSSIVLRDGKAWMFKEVDAPMLGWEVYARRDAFYTETGIALLANATKLDALSQKATDIDPNAETALFHALKAFTDNFIFGPYSPEADWRLSFEATVIGIKANEAIVSRSRIELTEDLFAL